MGESAANWIKHMICPIKRLFYEKNDNSEGDIRCPILSLERWGWLGGSHKETGEKRQWRWHGGDTLSWRISPDTETHQSASKWMTLIWLYPWNKRQECVICIVFRVCFHSVTVSQTEWKHMRWNTKSNKANYAGDKIMIDSVVWVEIRAIAEVHMVMLKKGANDKMR